MLRILLGLVIGVVSVPLALMRWVKFGRPPVADRLLPLERDRVAVPMRARIENEMIKNTANPAG